MKYLFLITVFSITVGCSGIDKSISAPPAYEPRFVTPAVGLWLREKPEIKASKLLLIPYGERIWVQREGQQQDTIDSKLGRWVSCEFAGKQGFVFDAYLAENFSETIKPSTPIARKAKNLFESSEVKNINSDERSRILDQIISLNSQKELTFPELEETFKFCKVAMKSRYGHDAPNFEGSPDTLVQTYIRSMNQLDTKALSQLLAPVIQIGCYPCDSIVFVPTEYVLADIKSFRLNRTLANATISERSLGVSQYKINFRNDADKHDNFASSIEIRRNSREHAIQGIFGENSFKRKKSCELHA